MTSDRTPLSMRPSAAERTANEEAELRALLAEAGPRTVVPAEDLALLHAAARGEWERTVAVRAARIARLRTRAAAALAAGIVLAAASVWWARSLLKPVAEAPLTTVAQQEGEAWIEEPATGGRGRKKLRRGNALEMGSIVGTGGAGPGGGGAGRVALRFAGGASLRLDAATRVRLAAPARLTLLAGRIYLDSGRPPRGAAAFAVETPLGTVRETGTQFEVRLDGADGVPLRVRVREGAVVLTRAGAAQRLTAGEELVVAADGRIRQGPSERAGPTWEWVQKVAPSLDIEGVTLADYLAWVVRETGWRLRYEDPELAGMAPKIVLHGTIEGMTPAESLDAVLPGSGLAFRVEGGTLRVAR